MPARVHTFEDSARPESAAVRPVRRRHAIIAAAGLVGATASLFLSGTAIATPAVTATPANVGLYGAQDPTYDGVYRQSLSIIGLVATGHTPDAAAVSWLLGQQCSDGAFTAYRASTATACTTANEDENATAEAVQALVALGKPTTTAIAALRTFQLADGGFYDNTAFGPAASDVNSTGLALSAFAAVGIAPASVTATSGKSGIDYLRALQLSCSATTGSGAYDYQTEATLHANDYATVQGLLGALGKALPVAPGAAGAAPACPATVTDAASSAAAATSYLAARLAATSGAIPSSFGSGTDWTTTANAVIDLEAAGAGGTPVAAAITALEASVKAYTVTSGASAPGPLATLLLVAHATGTDPATFGGINLAAALTATERAAVATPVPTAPAPVAAPKPTLPMTGAAGLVPLALAGATFMGLGLVALFGSRRRAAVDSTAALRSPLT